MATENEVLADRLGMSEKGAWRQARSEATATEGDYAGGEATDQMAASEPVVHPGSYS